jgi:hypothetical protein
MLAADPVRAIEIGLAGRAAVRRDYNWAHDAAELANLYGEISSSGTAA